MKTSQRGIELIKKYEGLVLYAYQCPSMVWTIGYGHTNGVYQGMTYYEIVGTSISDITELKNVATGSIFYGY